MPLYLKDKLVSGTGAQGSPGKSAYEAAKEGGYAGTEEEFNQILTSIPEHIANKNNPHGVTAAQAGAIPSSEKGAANGVATLGADALLAAAQRPKAGGLYRDDGTTTVEASLTEISTTLQNKAPLTKSMAMIGDMPSKIAVSNAGWYRAIKMTDPLAGCIVHIGHSYNSGGASDLLAYVHPYSVNPQVVILTSSKRKENNNMLIDDLRITQVGSSHTYYLDIHYSGTASINTIFLDAIASVQPDVDARSATQIMDLSAVADAPDGETAIATAEWQSPPMLLGKEYRTTERYLGKPVYVKAVDCGAMPASTSKKVEHGIKNISAIISCTGYFTTGNDPVSLPYARGTTTNVGSIWADKTGIVVWIDNSSYTNCNAYGIIKYTKVTD